MWHDYSRSRSTQPFYNNIPWLWVGILTAIVVVVWIARSFQATSTTDTDRPHLSVVPETAASTVFISMSESSKNRITGTGWQYLYVWDKSVSVETWGARVENDSLHIDMDEKTELIYTAHSSTGDTLSLNKWRIWINQKSDTSQVTLKNLSIKTQPNNVALLEQTNQIYSTVYAIVWDLDVSTRIGSYKLKSGNRMMISASDIASPGIELSNLVWGIDESIANNSLFIKNNGKKLLNSAIVWSTWAILSSSGSSSGTSMTSYVSFIEPIDGSISLKPTLAIRGSINSPEVKRVTLNDIESIVSPVNNTFSFVDFALWAEINNIVYKAYGDNNRLLEKWVLTIFGSKQASQSVNKLIPNSSPVSSKDFRISYPSINPYVMADRAIKVQWTVPKESVSSITVNDYKLQKYLPGTTTWYYFANIESWTLRDGINLYTIKFFGANNELLYTQLFTIIKESKNATLSGEPSR